jgi:hypothetical protein
MPITINHGTVCDSRSIVQVQHTAMLSHVAQAVAASAAARAVAAGMPSYFQRDVDDATALTARPATGSGSPSAPAAASARPPSTARGTSSLDNDNAQANAGAAGPGSPRTARLSARYAHVSPRVQSFRRPTELVPLTTSR